MSNWWPDWRRRSSWPPAKLQASKTLRTCPSAIQNDENGLAGIGDRVQLMETRPLSASKRWRLVEVLEKAK